MPLHNFTADYLWVSVTVRGDGPEELGILRTAASSSLPIDRELEILVGPNGSGWVLEGDWGRREAATALEAAEAAYGLVHDLVLQRARHHGWTRLHAALVEHGGSRIALAGVSGAGKTTLAIALLGAGADVHGDEAIFIRAGEAIALPRPFHVKAGGLGVTVPARALPRVNLDYIETIHVIDQTVVAGSSAVRAPATLDHLVILGPRTEAGSTIRPVATDEILRVMADDIVPFAADRGEALRELLSLSSAAECHYLAAGDPEDAVDLLLRAL